MHRGVSEGGYTKHTNLLAYTVCLVEASTAAACSCRTVYDVEGAGCPATHRTVDIVFVARNVAPDIYTALERIFDLDICVAAVGRERVPVSRARRPREQPRRLSLPLLLSRRRARSGLTRPPPPQVV